jgi:NTF2-like N-terminal transpeptidase domain
MRINRRLVWLAALALLITLWPQTLVSAARDDKAEVRSTVQRIFNQMKSRQYNDLYDSLSASSRSRMTRQRFTSSMQRMDDNYQLERIEIGAVRVRGNTAVVDTVIYGRVLKPSEGEGKIVAQQTLVREDGEWKVSSASPGAGLSSRPARIYLKRDGRWVDITAALRAAAGRRRS